MSLCFPFVLPVTNGFSFLEHFSPSHDTTLLSRADSARAAMANILTQTASQGNNTDYLSIVKAIDDYLPLLLELLGYNEETLISGRFNWRFASKSKISLPDKDKWAKSSEFDVELGYVCLVYALTLISLAQKSLNGSENQWKQSTAYLTKAQSVITYLIQRLAITKQEIRTSMRVELSHSVLNALSMTISGSLHLILLYKDIGESIDDYYKIPRTQAGVNLITRGAIFAYEKFSSASYLLENLGASQLFGGSGDQCKSWVKDAQAYCSAYAQRLMAMDNHTKGEVGVAIAYLNAAADTLNSSKFKVFKSKNLPKKAKNSGVALTNNTDSIGSTSDCATKNLQQASVHLQRNISSLLQLYKQENDTVAFQKVPVKLDQSWPSGREIIAPKKPWTPSGSEAGQDTSTDRPNYF